MAGKRGFHIAVREMRVKTSRTAMDAATSAANCTAVIVASGGSRRMGFDKLAADLAGTPVLRRTLDAIAASPRISEVILVCPHERWEALDAPQPTGVRFQRVDGGAERCDSVAAGLAVATSEWACVHDGARPLLALADLERCLDAAVADGAAALARRVVDTMRRGDAEGFAAEVVDRANLWALETPQCARTEVLRAALQYAKANGKCVTDETTALALAGVRVRLIESGFPNPKITTPADLALAHALIS